jgi:hypothetical protein
MILSSSGSAELGMNVIPEKEPRYVQEISYPRARFFLTTSVMTGSLALAIDSHLALAQDDEAEPGTFTQCVAWNNGITYAIINAGYREHCFQMARDCSGNPNVQVSWYAAPVLVQTPYTQCATR